MAVVVAPLEMQWNLFQIAANPLEMIWNLRTLVVSTLTMVWNLIGRIVRVFTMKWDLLNNGRTTTPQEPSLKKVADSPFPPSVKKTLNRGEE